MDYVMLTNNQLRIGIAHKSIKTHYFFKLEKKTEKMVRESFFYSIEKKLQSSVCFAHYYAVVVVVVGMQRGIYV
jgi:hypothetical protein